MKRIIMGLVVCVMSIAYAKDKQVILKDVNDYKIKYVIEETSYNVLWEGYDIDVAIYYDNNAVQYCTSSYLCGILINGIDCPDDTYEWYKELDYLDYDCFVAMSKTVKDLIPTKERPTNYMPSPTWRR